MTPQHADANAPTSPVLPRDEQFVAYVAGRELACPLCRYNLRGLSRPQCPECGKALQLRVVGEISLTAWVVMLAAAGMGAGVAFFITYVIFLEGGYHPGQFIGWVATWYFILQIPVTGLVVGLRRVIWRWNQQVQTACATAWVVIFVMMLALLFNYA